jgi:Zn-dependent M28 family amino/carboxypeptidase
MLRRSSHSILIFLTVLSCTGPGRTGPGLIGEGSITGLEMRAHTRFLSHDLLRGRAPGTPGGDIAAHYIASEFEEMGLDPVQGSYFQLVPVLGSRPLASGINLSFRREGRSASPQHMIDYTLIAGDAAAPFVEGSGELVFVGYGIDAPEANWNDFGEMDLTGKVLLMFVSDPPPTADEPNLFGGPAMTYYGRWTYKYEEAARRGALAAILIHTTETAGYPWSVVQAGRSREQFALPPDPSGPPPVPMKGWMTYEAAAWVLEMAGLSLDDLRTRAGERRFSPVPTGIQVSGQVTSSVRSVETMNVVGLLPGLERPDEVITITSHYDHLGVGEPVNGDSIRNGAYDNASGIALVLETAEAFATLPSPPARSILFIATAAEEAGLLGSGWYAQSPLFPLEKTVAEINVDGANLWGETNDFTVHGVERSGLGQFARVRAEELGLTLVPDQEPEKGFFFRSDHFPIARAGVPALYFSHGSDYRNRPEGYGDSIQADYQAQHYHAPSDEFSDEWVYDGAVQHALFVYRVVLDIAQDSTFPNWFTGSEFKAARDAMMGG